MTEQQILGDLAKIGVQLDRLPDDDAGQTELTWRLDKRFGLEEPPEWVMVLFGPLLFLFLILWLLGLACCGMAVALGQQLRKISRSNVV